MEDNKEIQELKGIDLITLFIIMSIFAPKLLEDFKENVGIDNEKTLG